MEFYTKTRIESIERIENIEKNHILAENRVPPWKNVKQHLEDNPEIPTLQRQAIERVYNYFLPLNFTLNAPFVPHYRTGKFIDASNRFGTLPANHTELYSKSKFESDPPVNRLHKYLLKPITDSHYLGLINEFKQDTTKFISQLTELAQKYIAENTYRYAGTFLGNLFLLRLQVTWHLNSKFGPISDDLRAGLSIVQDSLREHSHDLKDFTINEITHLIRDIRSLLNEFRQA